MSIAKIREELVKRAQEGSLNPDEMEWGTFTISNFGSLGVEIFTPIINPLEVAIAGVEVLKEERNCFFLEHRGEKNGI